MGNSITRGPQGGSTAGVPAGRAEARPPRERPVVVTVLLPVFNCASFVAQAIESVLQQSYEHYELLVIDDGSTDETPAILNAFASRSSRIRLLRHRNSGTGFTLNRGILEARGTLIAELGSDDIASPHRLERQAQFLERHPDHVLVGSYLKVIDSDGRQLGFRKYPVGDIALRGALPLYNPFASPSLMYRRSAALAAGGYTTRFATCEDYDFVLRIALRGKAENLPEPLTSYRLHSGAMKARRTVSQIKDTIRIRKTAFDEYGYHRTAAAQLVTLFQRTLIRLPPRLSYWLYRRIVITPRA